MNPEKCNLRIADVRVLTHARAYQPPINGRETLRFPPVVQSIILASLQEMEFVK